MVERGTVFSDDKEWSLKEIEIVIERFLNNNPDYITKREEIKNNILSKGDIEDIETRYIYKNIEVRIWRNYKDFTQWEKVTNVPYTPRTDIPFEGFPNYSFDMWDGVVPSRHGERYGNITNIYNSRYGELESSEDDSEVYYGSISYRGVNFFLIGDKLWVDKIPSGADGAVKVWCTNNTIPFQISKRQQLTNNDNIKRWLEHLPENIYQIKLFKRKALELFYNYS